MRLAGEGCGVALVGRSKEDLCHVQEQIERNGGEAAAFAADISQPKEIESACQAIGKRWGRMDVVFANAGINGVWSPLDELGPEEWDETLSTNLKGTFLTVKYALPWLKKNGGSVIVTSSVNGTRIFSNTGATAYSCSKAGQVAFAKMAALELARDKIRVNVICPGAISTHIDQNTRQRDLEGIRVPVEFPEGQIPLTHGVPGSPEQVAELVLFLASDRSSHVSGAEIFIDGAQSLLQG